MFEHELTIPWPVGWRIGTSELGETMTLGHAFANVEVTRPRGDSTTMSTESLDPCSPSSSCGVRCVLLHLEGVPSASCRPSFKQYCTSRLRGYRAAFSVAPCGKLSQGQYYLERRLLFSSIHREEHPDSSGQFSWGDARNHAGPNLAVYHYEHFTSRCSSTSRLSTILLKLAVCHR